MTKEEKRVLKKAVKKLAMIGFTVLAVMISMITLLIMAGEGVSLKQFVIATVLFIFSAEWLILFYWANAEEFEKWS